jgi:putative peptidoglycan lipid II flippase
MRRGFYSSFEGLTGSKDRNLTNPLTVLRRSASGRILIATSTVAGLTSLIKVISLFKEMLVARQFGASDALDAYYVAFLLPSFFTSVVSDSFNAAFIPTYLEVRVREGELAAQRLFSNVAFVNILLLVTLSILLATLQSWLLPLLGSRFDPRKLALTRNLFFVLLVSLSLSGLSVLWRATLNAHNRLRYTAITPIMTPLTILVALLIGGRIWGVHALAVGAVLGVAAELVLSGFGLWSIGNRLMPHWSGLDPSLRKVLSQYAPMVAGALLMGSTVLVDQSMAAMLGSGSVSYLNYANKLLALILSVAVTSLSIVILPTFSGMSANDDWSGLRRVLQTYTRLILAVAIPVSVILLFWSTPLIAIFFQRGAFTHDDVQAAARVQALLGLELPFYGLCILYVRAISSLKRNQILMWGTVINATANVLLNLLFMKYLGLAGIALSTACVYAISCTFLFFMLQRALREQESLASRMVYRVVRTSTV